MNEILKAALTSKYTMTDAEADQTIAKAKKDGKLLELYEIAIMKLELEMKRSV